MKYLRTYPSEDAYQEGINALLYDSSASLDYPYIVSYVRGSANPVRYDSIYIEFADDYVRSKLLTAYDTNHDGHLTTFEAGAITSLTMFAGDRQLTSFSDVRSLKALVSLDLHGSALRSIDVSELPKLQTLDLSNTTAACRFGNFTELTDMQRMFYRSDVPMSEVYSFLGLDAQELPQTEINNYFNNL